MDSDDTPPKKPYRNRSKELAKLRKARLDKADEATKSPHLTAEESVTLQLDLLLRRTRDKPTDADADIDFAYRNMAHASVDPLLAPSTAAWAWYAFAREEPSEFLKITQKREDAKAKMAGTITNQRMEDDRRNQFAILDRIEKQLTIDVKTIVKDLMSKFPDDVLHECRKFKAEWKSFLERYPK